MTNFTLDGQNVSIRDQAGNIAVLNPLEALQLLQWLSEHNNILLSSARQSINVGQNVGQELEIHLYQENLGHLDELKAALPGLHEYRPPARVLSVPLEEVTERAIELLKEFQVEYWIHPLLDEDDVFAQA
ncbi:MAG TPA: hypothetical protein VKV20_16720 [Ktedonobacteraceae bacterium]|jgi:hypothetical protein|nr:hypothetical protein [Ktedonobacteraceae bacterium]